MPKGKEEFVQSVAQFIVEQDSELELEPFQVDPDLPVPWKFIEAIRIFGQEETEVATLKMAVYLTAVFSVRSASIRQSRPRWVDVVTLIAPHAF